MAPQVLVRVGTFFVLAGMAFQPAFGQGRGGGTSTGGTTGTGAGASPTTGTTPTRPPVNSTSPTQQPQTPQQPIFLSGRVLLEDGSAPTESVVIERVCSGQPHAEGYTDSKGYFSIQLGARNGVLQDASEENNGRFGNGDLTNPLGSLSGPGGASGSSAPRTITPEQRLLDCELRARLAGYRSQAVSLANHRAMDPPDVGTILLHRMGASEGTTVSMASLAAPKDARKAYERGLDALKKKKTEDARKDFEKAIELYPKYSLALCELGKLQSADGNMVDARKMFDAAVAADPKYVVPYLEISVLDLRAQSWQELVQITDQAIKLDAFDYPQAFYYNAVANYYLKNFDSAEKSARQVEKLDTHHQFTKNSHLLGVLLAQRQDYNGAIVQFKNYLKLDPSASDAETVRTQLSRLEKIVAESKEQE